MFLSQTLSGPEWGIEARGPFEPTLVLGLAIVLGVFAWLYYRREVVRHDRRARWLLPGLRAVTVILLVLIFVEPTVVQQGQALERGRVLVVLDESRSLGRADPSMPMSRKLALAVGLGLLDEDRIAGQTEEELEDLATSTDVEVQRALAEVESLTRWQRAQRLLFDSERGVLRALSWPHVVELAMTGEQLVDVPLAVADSAGEAEEMASPVLGADPAGAVTNLNLAVEEAERRDVQALVLLSDGRHNVGVSPLEAAGRLGARGAPVFPVGLGSAVEPMDVGVLDAHVPATVYEEDRIEGKLVLKISAPAGRRLEVIISLADDSPGVDTERDVPVGATQLWRREIESPSEGSSGIVELAFVLPANSLSRGRPRLAAEISVLPGEASTRNNRLEFLLTVKKRDLRILLVDGRPRWTWRYLKRLFERDEKVSVKAVVAGLGSDGAALPRGSCEMCFPESRKELAEYDLVIFGDISTSLFREEELTWLRDFVDEGGGLILIAGRRGHSASWTESALAPLVPVRIQAGSSASGAVQRFRLTAAGKSISSVKLDDDPEANEGIWQLLRPGLWVQAAEALPGAEVWVETAPGRQKDGVPVLARKRFGRGNVLYLGYEETWRWRYKVADRYHARFWSQQADYFREEDFAVSSTELALDTDRASYAPGDPVRVRLWSADRGVAEGTFGVELWRGEKRLRSLTFDSPDGTSGIQATLLEGLETGRYVLRSYRRDEESGDSFAQLTLPFDVVDGRADEDLFLTWDEDLLDRLALRSGGVYLREEQIRRLPELLSAKSLWRDETSQWPLTQGWLALVLISVLLGLEWVVRKRVGLL